MRIATFNVNSIRSRLPVLSEWLKSQNPDVLCLQETKCTDDVFPLEEVKNMGYEACFKGQKSYNGVAILSKKAADEVRVGFDDGIEPLCESRLIAARFGSLWVVNSYVPQGKSIDHADYLFKQDFLRRAVDLVKNLGPQVIWVGDFNVAPTELDVANPKTKKDHVCFHAPLRELFTTLTADLVDLFRTKNEGKEIYSFFDYRVKDALDRNLGWRIDHIMATPDVAKACESCFVDHEPRRAEKPSDHTPVVADFGKL